MVIEFLIVYLYYKGVLTLKIDNVFIRHTNFLVYKCTKMLLLLRKKM